ncbi:MAG TPA: hypothetical protein VMT09_16605 [Steroidobacteraceae bacterium]|nr:hypothetical protein [Steroidobacteraceae bacterium]
MSKALGWLLLGATAAVAGCAGGPKADTPPGVVLAGSWKLDHAASDDPQQVIAKMRNQARKIIERQMSAAGDEPARSGPGGRGGPGGAQPPEGNAPLTPDDPAGGHGGRRPDPLQYSPMMHALASVIARGDYLTVRQSSQELVFDFGTIVRSFTPGAHSVVSSEMGVADQISGWEGREYVIRVKPQLGPPVVESFGLSPDGQRLIEKLHIGPAELPAESLTRVYDRSTDAAPRPPPTTD